MCAPTIKVGLCFHVLMTFLVVTPQQLTEICKRSGTTLDCTNCNLTTLPQDLMDNTMTDLLLADNLISMIPNNSFANMTSLKTLVLTNNPLQFLHSDAFKGK